MDRWQHIEKFAGADRACTFPLLLALAGLLVGALPARAQTNCTGVETSGNFSSTLSLPPAVDPQFAPIRVAIAQHLFLNAESLLGNVPPGAEASTWQGILLLHEGKTFASIRSLEKAARFRDSSTIETLLGVDYLLLNQRQLAEQAIKKALTLSPGDTRGIYLQGRLHFVSHDYPKATEEFRAVLEKEPDDYRSLYYLGFSEWRAARADVALRHLRRAVDVVKCLPVNFALAPQTLAELELQNGDLNNALAHADLALSMASQSADEADKRDGAADILLDRGKIHQALGKQEDAIEDWQRAVQLNPALGGAWFLLAHLYRQRGEKQRADDALNHFQAIHEEM